MKLSTSLFPVFGSACIGAAAGEVTGDAAEVVVAGDIAAMGDMPGIGDTPETAGLIVVTGAVGGAPAGLESGGGDGWPKEVNTKVTEQRLAISSVFIGLIGKVFLRLDIR